MDKKIYLDILEDYEKTKRNFQSESAKSVAKKITSQIKEHSLVLDEVFDFLIFAFNGRFRMDEKTPLVFHSIYLTKLLYLCGEKNLENLLIASLHDVLEDTNVTEAELEKKEFIEGKKIILKIKLLKEDNNLSREPDGKNLPPRYKEHIKRLLGAPREVINVELLDRFCDLIDLDYVLKLPSDEREMRIKSKIIKVKSFVENIVRGRNDLNESCLKLFDFKVEEIEERYKVKARAELVF